MSYVDPNHVATAFAGAALFSIIAYIVNRQKAVTHYVTLFLLLHGLSFLIDGFLEVLREPLTIAGVEPLGIAVHYSIGFLAIASLVKFVSYTFERFIAVSQPKTSRARMWKLHPILFVYVFAAIMVFATFIPGAILEYHSVAPWYILGATGFIIYLFFSLLWLFSNYWHNKETLFKAPVLIGRKEEIVSLAVGIMGLPFATVLHLYAKLLVPDWIYNIVLIVLGLAVARPTMVLAKRRMTFDQFFWAFSNKEQLCLLKAAFQQSSEGIAITDVDDRIVLTNSSWEEMHNYEQNELSGKKLSIVYGENQIKETEEMEKALAIHDSWSGEIYHLRKDGTAFPTMTTINRLRDAKGQLLAVLSISKDITRKKTEDETLRETSQKLATILHTANEGIAIADSNDYFTFSNKSFADMLGYNEKELLGKKIDELSDEEGSRKIKSETKTRKEGKTSRYELTLYRKDGEPRTVQVSASPLFAANGSYAGALGIIADITERKNMEKQLKESEEKFRLIAESSFDAILTVDLDGRITYASPAVERVVGHKPEDMIGKPFHDYLMEANITQVLEVFSQISSGKNIEGFSVENRKPDGSKGYVEVNASPIIVGGNIIGIQAIARDITGKKRMENALLESEAKLRSIVESSPDGIALIDVNGSLIDCNQAVLEMIGYATKEEAIGTHSFAFISPTDQEKFTEYMKKLLEQNVVKNIEYTLATKDGHELPVEASASIVKDSSGNPKYIVGLIRDITERKRAEEALRSNEEKYRLLFENIHDVVFSYNSEFKLISLSPSVEKSLGYKPEELIGKPIHELNVLTPESLETAKSSAMRVLNGEQTIDVYEFIRKDGSKAFGEITGSPIICDGKIVGVISVARDITERKLMERALQDEKERFRAISETAKDAIIVINDEWKLAYWNPAAERILGYTKDDAIGKEAHQIILPERYREGFLREMRKFKENGVALDYENMPEIYAVRKDGAEIPVELSLSAFTMKGKWHSVGIIRDVTDRKKMEEVLRDNEERFRSISTSAKDAIILIDDAGKISYWNPAATEIFGYTEEETVGKNVLELLIPAHSREAMSAGLGIFGKTGHGSVVGRTMQMTVVRKDGVEIPIELSISAFQMKGKMHATGIIRDITERKQMEQKIMESEERLRQLIEFAPDAIYINDLNGNFIDGNKQAEELVGYGKEELIGKNMFQLGVLQEKYLQSAAEDLEKNIHGEKSGPREYELIRKDGSTVIAEISTIPVKRSGKTEVLGIARDTTERRRIEDALRESEEKVRNILQSSPNAIAATDLNGNIIDCNQASLEMYELSKKEELLGINIFTLVAKRDHARMFEDMSKALEQGGMKNVEYAMQKKNGSEFPGEVSVSLAFDASGKPKYVVATIKDITVRKQMEEKLEEYAQQLEDLVEKRTTQLKEAQAQLIKSERLAAIGQVAAMIGHDLRNPLTGIAGATYYLKTRLATKLDDKTKEMIQLIEKDIEYSNKIITDLLEYSRELRLELTETTPKAIINEALSLFEIPTGIQLQNSTQDEPKIKIDMDKMKRVFSNLIKNAIDAMPKGGILTVQSTKTNRTVEFVLTDNGMGMTKDQMEKIWTPFFTTKAKGMGLGLPICRRIMEAHKGQISAESMAGVGTTFTVTVPIEPQTIEGGEEIWMNVPESLLSTTTKA